jgi:hypothetical protein
MQDLIKPKGEIEIVVTNVETGDVVKVLRQNTVLNNGRAVLARAITQDFSEYDFYINSMVFGTGGEDGAVPKVVDPGRTSLYNEALSISVNKSWDPNYPTRGTFTGTISSVQGNNFTINEAGLVTSTGDLFSIATFSGLSKSSQLQFTLNWNIVFI